jgi:hypothetical protein
LKYERFHVTNKLNRFTLLDQGTGWVWLGISRYSTVLAMMKHILSLEHSDDTRKQFRSDEYRRITKLEGEEWEAELLLLADQR